MTSSSDKAWASLVHRSQEAQDAIQAAGPASIKILREWTGLDEFMDQAPKTLMFWFFQRREAFLSQTTMQKWSRDRLDDYVLLPASPGYVLRTYCFFVSHFWQTRDDPDPDGTYLRLVQDNLRLQSWDYVWVDWSCIPQHPRSSAAGAGKAQVPVLVRARQRVHHLVARSPRSCQAAGY